MKKGELKLLTMDYDIKVSDKELSIMQDLYNYRVMTTEQIRKRHFNNSGTYVNKVLWKMRNKGYVKSNILKNSRKNKKGYAYHRLTETGVECLVKHDTSVEVQSNIYVKPKQVPYLLMTNDLVVDLTNTEWEIWDSRKVKEEYNLDQRMNIQGLLISPDKKRYGLYVMSNRSSLKTIGKIQSEIKANADLLLHDYIIVTQGLDSYKEFISRAVETVQNNGQKKEPLLTGHAIKLYPYKPFITKASVYNSEIDWIKKLCKHYGYELKSTAIPEGERQSFPFIVEVQGKEYYLVDLTDSDLQKYNDIEVYCNSQASRHWEKRDIIAVAFSIPTKTNQRIDELHGVNFKTITNAELRDICSLSA